MPIMAQWVIGLPVSILGGGLASWAFIALSRRLIGLGDKPSSGAPRVSPWLTGVVERSFFTPLVALNVAGYPAAMIGWLALKLATNWNHPAWKERPEARTHGFLALLAGLVSLLFAVLGGAICAGTIRVGI